MIKNSKEVITIEEWADVLGFPQYRVSSFGRVYSKRRERLLKPNNANNGYQMVALFGDQNKRKYCLLHRVVYEAFYGAIPNGLYVNHKDEDKHNNHLDNLELVTFSENVRYGTASARRLHTRIENMKKNNITWWNKREKPCINVTTGQIYPSASAATKAVNGSRAGIINACNKKRKTYRKEVWEYL